jgi:superfamily II DNA/RNA helicase
MPDRKPYEKMKRDLLLEYGEDKIIAANAAAVTNKLQQMASGFVYDNKTIASEEKGKFTMKQKVIWFATHKFELIEEILNENQRDNTIIVYNYKEELAELMRR